MQLSFLKFHLEVFVLQCLTVKNGPYLILKYHKLSQSICLSEWILCCIFGQLKSQLHAFLHVDL